MIRTVVSKSEDGHLPYAYFVCPLSVCHALPFLVSQAFRGTLVLLTIGGYFENKQHDIKITIIYVNKFHNDGHENEIASQL